MNSEPVAEERLIDHEVIGKLLEIQERTRDPEFFGSVLDLFFEHTPTLLTNLANAATAQDVVSVQRIAHRLKGSSVSVGAMALSNLCASMEHAASSGSLDCAARDSTQAREIYDRTKIMLTSLRHNASGSGSRRVPAQSLV